MQRAQDVAVVRAAGVLAELGPEQVLAAARYLDDEALAELVAGAEYRREQLRAAAALRSGTTVDPPPGPPGALAALLVDEQPQTVAAVLASLSAADAAALTDALPVSLRERALVRLAALESCDAAAMRALGRALTELCHGGERVQVSGMERATGLLSRGDGTSGAGGGRGERTGPNAERERVLAELEAEAPALARALRIALGA